MCFGFELNYFDLYLQKYVRCPDVYACISAVSVICVFMGSHVCLACSRWGSKKGALVLYKMKLLELFSGTKSVGKVAEQLGYEVTSVDLKNADINCDIMNWNYTVYESGHFDVIWASPPLWNTVVLKQLAAEI